MAGVFYDEPENYFSRRCLKCGQKTTNITFDIEGQKSALCQKCLDERIIFYAEEDTYVEKIFSRIESAPLHLNKFIVKYGGIILRNSNVAVNEYLETYVGFTLHRKEMITVDTLVTARHMVVISKMGLSERVDTGVKKPVTINPRVSSMIERIEEP